MKQGENQFKLGAKLDNTSHKESHKVEREPTIKSVESMSETWKPPNKVKKFQDPRKYMRDNDIICQKFNYSVPQSFDDKKALIRLSDDQKCLEIFNIFNLEANGLIKSIPINDLTGFIYGSFSTRFWMMRIGINQQISDNYHAHALD